MVPMVSRIWYRYSSVLLLAKYSLMLGPSRSTYRAPVAMRFRIESAMSSGEAFCYDADQGPELDLYRYDISSGSSTKLPDAPYMRQYTVAGDSLYYVENLSWGKGYALYCMNLVSGTTSKVFELSSDVVKDCRSIGVDGSGRVCWATNNDNMLYVFDQTGRQLASANAPVYAYQYQDYSATIMGDFVSFDETNGNFYFEGFANLPMWGYDHRFLALYVGNFDGSTLTLTDKAISLLYQNGYYYHFGCVEPLSDRYLADLASPSGGYLAILDSHAIDVNDVGGVTTSIDLTTGGTQMTAVALPAKDIVFDTETHEARYEDDEDVTSVGARCAYFETSDLLAVSKGGRQAVCYRLSDGTAQGRINTAYDIYKLMNMGGQLTIIERDDDGTFYIERFSMVAATRVTLSGSTKLEVGGKADYTVNASTDLKPEVVFTSSDLSVLSIDSEGRASAHKKGTVTITATTASGLEATRKVTVDGGGVNKTLPDVTALSGAKVNNWNANDYFTNTSPVTSYLAETPSGLMRVQARKSDVLIEYYNAAGKVTSSKTIRFELSLFGGFFAGDDGSFYLAFGQANTKESNSQTVVRVERYNSSWKRLGACDLKGANTTTPFDAESLRMDEADGKLYVHTCHEMYQTEDGYNHQANMTFVINEVQMSLADSYFDMMNLSTGYVSHSFNQFVRVADGVLNRVDHGDLYPRGIAYTMTNVADEIASPFQVGLVWEFDDGRYDNYTGASLGGMELSDSRLLVALNKDVTFFKNPRNVFVASLDLSSGEAMPPTQVTSYEATSSVTCLTPHLVRVNDRHFLLMWAEKNEDTGAYSAQFALLDHSGNVVAGPVRKVLPISDCQPIVLSDGSVAWYVSSDNKVTLYTINPYDLKSMSNDNFDKLLQVSLANAIVTRPGNQDYTGKPLTPKPKVVLGGSQLVEGVDYTLSYKNNTNVGTATITIKGIGSYSGTKTVTFYIRKKRTGWKRLSGKASLDTMNAIVNEGWENGCGGTVVVARYDDFKDALAGAGLSGLTGGPIVLTRSDRLSPNAAAQLKRLKPTRVYIAGGESAITWNVMSDIMDVTNLPMRADNSSEATGVIRLWGNGSPETSAELANAGKGGWLGKTAIIATNKSFKDALSAAPISYAMHWPILLASKGERLSHEVIWTLLAAERNWHHGHIQEVGR